MCYTNNQVVMQVEKKSGFTIIELLAVIVILAVLLIVGGSSVINIINKAKRDTAGEMRNNLKEAAISYVLENKYLTKCSLTFSKEMFEDENVNASNLNKPENKSCIERVTVGDLKKEGLFEDSKNVCKDTDAVIVYRYTAKNATSGEEYSEYKAYASDTTCTN